MATKDEMRGLAKANRKVNYYIVSLLTMGLLIVIVAFLGVDAVLAGQSRSNHDLLEKNKQIAEDQTSRIIGETTDIKSLQQQNNDLQQLSLCMLQLLTGGNFTDRADCQQRIQHAQDTINASRQPQPQPTAQPTGRAAQPAPAAATATTLQTPKPCTVNLLGICL